MQPGAQLQPRRAYRGRPHCAAIKLQSNHHHAESAKGHGNLVTLCCGARRHVYALLTPIHRADELCVGRDTQCMVPFTIEGRSTWHFDAPGPGGQLGRGIRPGGGKDMRQEAGSAPGSGPAASCGSLYCSCCRASLRTKVSDCGAMRPTNLAGLLGSFRAPALHAVEASQCRPRFR